MLEKGQYNLSPVNEKRLLIGYWQKGTGVRFTEFQFWMMAVIYFTLK